MTEMAPLEPPVAAEALTLTAPDPVQPVAATAAPKLAPKVDPALVGDLEAKADDFLAALLGVDAKSPQFAAQADAVRRMGDKEIRAASNVSNQMLERPVKEMKEGGISEASAVSQSLLELRRTVEDLDPGQSATKKLFRRLPFGNKVTDYFRKYESSQKQLNAILNSLYSGQDRLRKDNAALTLERQNLWDTMARLNQYIYLAERLDTRLSAKIAEVEASDPDTARALREDVLFYVRQKHQDLLTQLAVSIQGYLAMDIIIKNNIELIKGVDRATTTTISALRTAVIVAQALASQKLVLDQITALNDTTSRLIESTSKMLVDNSTRIQSQAAASTIGLPQLQAAFANIYSTLDSISTFKIQALDSMAATIGTLETETTKAKEYLDRSRRNVNELMDTETSTVSLDLPTA
ncbi:MAG: toxic anion resistance protein [Micrococcales bacterium]|nr:toxic anion resistance protein [Micrococcales bacterium]